MKVYCFWMAALLVAAVVTGIMIWLDTQAKWAEYDRCVAFFANHWAEDVTFCRSLVGAGASALWGG